MHVAVFTYTSNKPDVASAKQRAVVDAQVEQEEEYIANRLLKRLEVLKREKQARHRVESSCIRCSSDRAGSSHW